MAKINKEKEAFLTQERLKQVLSYDSQSGIFVWIKKSNPKVSKIKIGQVAGYVNRGYVSIGIDGYHYQAHRLVWMYVHGYFPDEDKPFIDHVDGNRYNNRIDNLRVCSAADNQKNKKKGINNTSGITGVYRTGTPNGNKTKINYYHIATWYDENGNPKCKKFSVKEYGEEKAEQLAMAYRVEQIHLLEIKFGVKYSNRHGT